MEGQRNIFNRKDAKIAKDININRIPLPEESRVLSNRKLQFRPFRLAAIRFDQKDLLGVLCALSEAGG